MLKELYHGKINPSERIPRPEPTNMSREWIRLSEEFEKTLTPEQVEIYHRLSDLQSESASLDNEALYVQGFRDGARMMMDVLGE